MTQRYYIRNVTVAVNLSSRFKSPMVAKAAMKELQTAWPDYEFELRIEELEDGR